MKIIKEFKEFALRGSVTDLAFGVIIGAAFSKIISSLVADIIMPPLGLLVGNMDFSKLRLVLKAAGADGHGEVAIAYGLFIQNSVDFLLVAVALFFVVRIINQLRAKPESPTPEDIVLLREIRDLLRVKSRS